MVLKRPWIEGLRPVSGSLRLMSLRLLLFVLAALPGLARGIAGLTESLANRPYFADAPDPLPLLPLMRMLGRFPESLWGLLALTAVVAWLGNLLLTAGAVALFGTARDGRTQVWRTVFHTGTRSLWAYLRIALMALALAALGAALIGVIAGRLLEHGRVAMWTLHTQFVVQAARGLATLCWLTLVGVFAWWCRVIVVADERRRVRRLWGVVPRLWRRRPVAALLLHFLLALGGLSAGAAVLFAWRQSSAGALGWALLWLAVLAGSSFLWHWRLRAGRLLWSNPDLIDLRAVPDVPWKLPTKLFSKLRRRPRGTGPAAAEPADG